MPPTIAWTFFYVVFVFTALISAAEPVLAIDAPRNVKAYAVCQHGSELPGLRSTRTDFVMWDGVPGAAYYNVYRTQGTSVRVNSPPDFIRGTYRGTAFSFPPVSVYTSQASLTVYVGYFVQACDASNRCSAVSSTFYAGCNANINQWCSVLVPGSCKICGGLFASPPGSFTASTSTSCGGNVNASWQMSSCADNYLIYKQTGNTFLKPTTSLSDTVSGLPAGSSETFFVRAFNSEGQTVGINSNTSTATASSVCQPPPSNVRVSTNCSLRTNTVIWNDPVIRYNTVYDVFDDGQLVARFSRVPLTTDESIIAVMTNIDLNRAHTYTVVANRTGLGLSPPSDPVVAPACNAPPPGNACKDIGLRVKTPSGTETFCGEYPPTSASPLRIYKSSGPNGAGVYGIVLVDPSDPKASKVRIKTSAGVKALKKI